MNHTPRIREKWSKGQLCVGTAASLADAAVSELYGEAGFDFVWIDMEHSAMTIVDAAAHVRAAQASGAASWIRVPSNDPVVSNRSSNCIRLVSLSSDRQYRAGRIGRPQLSLSPSRRSRVRSLSRRPLRADLHADYLAQVDDQMMVILQIEHIDAIKTSTASSAFPASTALPSAQPIFRCR